MFPCSRCFQSKRPFSDGALDQKRDRWVNLHWAATLCSVIRQRQEIKEQSHALTSASATAAVVAFYSLTMLLAAAPAPVLARESHRRWYHHSVRLQRGRFAAQSHCPSRLALSGKYVFIAVRNPSTRRTSRSREEQQLTQRIRVLGEHPDLVKNNNSRSVSECQIRYKRQHAPPIVFPNGQITENTEVISDCFDATLVSGL
jgi:hypothetical protein